MPYNYDLLVIGAGSGGLAAAKQSAKYGAKVAIAESRFLGGVCVNQGCISKKLMVFAADFAKYVDESANYGWNLQTVAFDWDAFKQNRDREVERLRDVQHKALIDAGVELIQGYAVFEDAHTVNVGDRTITADKILIAVGGKPILPKLPGIEHAITSDDIFNLPEIPQRLAIIGSGYIGVEFASIFRYLGSEVTIVDRSDSILSGFDDDLRNHVRQGLMNRGIQSLINASVTGIEATGNELQLLLEEEPSDPIMADKILCAVGRAANLDGLRLEKADVELAEKAIAVDEFSRTSCPNIFAVGDCTNRLPLTPVARAEGRAFADTVFGDRPRAIDYVNVPSAVFARPEAAAVGLTEAQAKAEYGEETIRNHHVEFQSLYSSVNRSADKSLIKLVIHQPTDRVLGIHLVCEHAAEMVQGMTAIVKEHVTKADLEELIGVHPTSAEEFFTSI
jgi:glutathione reductase (NADPH)